MVPETENVERKARYNLTHLCYNKDGSPPPGGREQDQSLDDDVDDGASLEDHKQILHPSQSVRNVSCRTPQVPGGRQPGPLQQSVFA